MLLLFGLLVLGSVVRYHRYRPVAEDSETVIENASPLVPDEETEQPSDAED